MNQPKSLPQRASPSTRDRQTCRQTIAKLAASQRFSFEDVRYSVVYNSKHLETTRMTSNGELINDYALHYTQKMEDATVMSNYTGEEYLITWGKVLDILSNETK